MSYQTGLRAKSNMGKANFWLSNWKLLLAIGFGLLLVNLATLPLPDSGGKQQSSEQSQ
jgi:hypothetical protein